MIPPFFIIDAFKENILTQDIGNLGFPYNFDDSTLSRLFEQCPKKMVIKYTNNIKALFMLLECRNPKASTGGDTKVFEINFNDTYLMAVSTHTEASENMATHFSALAKPWQATTEYTLDYGFKLVPVSSLKLYVNIDQAAVNKNGYIHVYASLIPIRKLT